MRHWYIIPIVTLLATSAACHPYEIATPTSFVELEEARHSQYDYRATTADGVVVAVRWLENDRRGTLEFWSEAITSKIRDSRGYALIEARDVSARSGLAGKQLRFGRDESGHTYTYWVTLFVRHVGRKPRLWVIEAGGQQEVFEQRREEVESMIAAFRPL